MDFWAAFLLGLVGSFHCAGMCGPLAIALPGAQTRPAKFFIGRAAYNLGRILTYSLLGLVFGTLGRTLGFAGIQRWVSLSLGLTLLLVLLGSRQLHLSSWISKFVERLKAPMSSAIRRRSFASMVTLGLLNGLLPCGLVYVASAGAVATGAVLSGVAYMAAFGAGTLPMMLAVSLSGKLIPFSLRLKLQRAVPVSIFVLALLLIIRGMSLGIPYLSPDLVNGQICCHK
jgi:sulfite exporter TauE/SafE